MEAKRRVKKLFAIVAMGRNGEIGAGGGMPWHLPEDLRHFKELTMGHPVVMGRATWESLPKRPLPGRLNVVLSRREDFEAPGAFVARSIEEAIELLEEREPGNMPFVIGGGTVYAQAMPETGRLYVTRIEETFPDADTYFPAIEGFELIEETGPMESKSGLRYRYETYESSNNQ